MNEAKPGETILIIDDEQSTLNMLRLLLGAYGYTVYTADSGENGLEIFRQTPSTIVLTDIRMPGIDGIEVLKRLKQMEGDVEVIVVTGHGDMELAVLALQNEASDFINKPIQKQALEVALRRAKDKISLRKQLQDYTLNLEAKVLEATAELSRYCRQLETMHDLSRSVGETISLRGITDLLYDSIRSLTRLQCFALLVLNSQRDSLVSGHHDPKLIRIDKDHVARIRELQEQHVLSDAEMRQIFRVAPQHDAEKMVLLPILREGELPAGAVLLGLPAQVNNDELRLVGLFLSQAAGAIRRAVVQEEELGALRRMAGVREQFGDIIGRHEKMEQVYRLIANIADSDASVLIQGESGTGKELVARRIHDLSSRGKGPFIAISCAAFPQTLLESELFGYEKGAFTGATHTKKGSFEHAHGGTIFLDEIGEIPITSQVKLLRVIQFKEFQRIGGESTIKVDVRVLAATSRNLRSEMEQGNFREDLYYRLHVIPIMLPPLRDRMSDLPLLASHFLHRSSERSSKKVVNIKPTAMDVLMNHNWPGNIRELENVMEHAFILARGESIEVRDLPAYMQEPARFPHLGEEGLEEVEKQHLIRVLKQCQGNKIQAAKRLKISRSTLYRKLEAYKLLDL